MIWRRSGHNNRYLDKEKDARPSPLFLRGKGFVYSDDLSGLKLLKMWNLQKVKIF